MKLPRFVSTLVAPVVLSTAVFAADFAPAIIYDMGGKFDKSFNQSANDGTVRFKKETGIEVREFEVTNAAQREQAMTRFAQDVHSGAYPAPQYLVDSEAEVVASFRDWLGEQTR